MREWKTGTTELAPGVFAYVQATGGFCIANAGILRTNGSSTVIDALFTPAMTRALLDETKRVSPGPIERLINTHHHIDHTLGNALFPAETRVLAHARARAEAERVGLGMLGHVTQLAPHFAKEVEGAQARLPDETFDGASLDVDLGTRRGRLLHFGTGHTRGDVLLHLPAERILFMGDVAFFYVTPLAFEGHIGAWIKVCERILAMDDVETLVPGHGPAGTKDDLRAMLGYLQLVRTGARKAFDAEVPAGEAARSIDLGEYAEWCEPERLNANVGRLYAEFRGELESIL